MYSNYQHISSKTQYICNGNVNEAGGNFGEKGIIILARTEQQEKETDREKERLENTRKICPYLKRAFSGHKSEWKWQSWSGIAKPRDKKLS